jgi:hypothetical protein
MIRIDRVSLADTGWELHGRHTWMVKSCVWLFATDVVTVTPCPLWMD